MHALPVGVVILNEYLQQLCDQNINNLTMWACLIYDNNYVNESFACT